MKTILVDIDHTLSDAAWRDGMERGGKEGWEEYYKAGDKDEPHGKMVDFINSLHDFGYNIVAVTGRPEKWRSATTNWLVRHGVMVDEILMRPENNFKTSPLVKIELVRERFSSLKREVLLIIDDREDIINMFKANGIIGLQVHHP